MNRIATPRRSRNMHATFFLNPLYLYTAACATTLILYFLSWSALYAPLKPTLVLFMVATAVISLAGGTLLQRRIRALPHAQRGQVHARQGGKVTVAIVASFLVQFLIIGQIPFVEIVLQGSTTKYGEFPQIPVLGVILTTFAIFYSTVVSYRFSSAQGKVRLVFLVQFVAIQFMLLLLLNRGAIMLCIFSAGLLILSNATLSLKRILWASALTLTIAYLFGGIGNLREDGTFFESAHIVRLAYLSDRYPDSVPNQFVWAYMYAVSPLGNLNHAVIHQAPLNDFGLTLVNIAPDFATKRLFTNFDPATPIVMSYFNVSTGYASAWKFDGFLGLWVTFFALIMLVTLAARASNDGWARITLALGGSIVAFMFFQNALSYSGISFALAYPVMGTLLGIPAIRRK